jgi:uncharacterized protein
MVFDYPRRVQEISQENILMKVQKLFIAALAIMLFTFPAFAQEPAKEQKVRPGYDAELAKKLGADQYGMRSYVIAFLRTGPTKIEDKAEVTKLFAGHLANINRLAAEGKMTMAGPFSKDPDFRGMFILAVETVEEAQKLVETDPAVKAGLLKADYHKWWGSAALMEVNRIHDKVQKVDM